MNVLNIIFIGIVQMGLISMAQGQQAKKMNVLFILVDDLRPSIGCYGDTMAITPNMDKLASQGVLFQKAYCQQAVCNPSRTSLLTGLRPDDTGVTDLQAHFRTKCPDIITLPQWFKNNGYYTVGIGKTTHGTKATADDISWTKEISANSNTYALPENQVKQGKGISTEMADVSDDMYSDGKIADSTISVIRETQQTNTPFFIAAGFRKPHAPFNAPKKYWDLYDRSAFEVKARNRPESSPDLAFHQWQELRGYKDIPDSGPLSGDKEKELLHAYYASISYVDAQIGKLLKELDQTGLHENTIIVLWGDHGYHLGEQDLWCKSTNFELDVRVPLLIADPRAKGNGLHTDAVVETVDIYPTLNELCDIVADHKLSGISLAPLLNTPKMKWDKLAFSQFARPYDVILGKQDATHIGYSVRNDNFRATFWYNAHTQSWEDKELYLLDKESIEYNNIAGDRRYRKVEDSLFKAVKEYRKGGYEKK